MAPPPAHVPGANRWLRSVAALGLPTSLDLPATPLGTDAWNELRSGARRHRLAGALASAITDGRWPATAAQEDEALRAHQALCSRDLLLERQLLETDRLLARAGISSLVLKGPALAHLAYPSPDLRSFRDVDLLVPASEIDDAVRVITDAGGRRHYPEPRPGFDRRFSKGVALTTAAGFEVDVHRTLTGGVHGALIAPDDLWEGSQPLRIGDRPLRAPGPEVLALHACIHAVLGDSWPRLENLRDVAVTTSHPAVDLPRVWAVARSWEADAVVAYAIGAAWTELDLDPEAPPAVWAAAQQPSPRAQRRLAPYLGAHRSHARQAVAVVGAIPGWPDRARYLRAIMLPAHARRSHAQRWRRGLAALGARGAR